MVEAWRLKVGFSTDQHLNIHYCIYTFLLSASERANKTIDIPRMLF